MYVSRRALLRAIKELESRVDELYLDRDDVMALTPTAGHNERLRQSRVSTIKAALRTALPDWTVRSLDLGHQSRTDYQPYKYYGVRIYATRSTQIDTAVVRRAHLSASYVRMVEKQLRAIDAAHERLSNAVRRVKVEERRNIWRARPAKRI